MTTPALCSIFYHRTFVQFCVSRSIVEATHFRDADNKRWCSFQGRESLPLIEDSPQPVFLSCQSAEGRVGGASGGNRGQTICVFFFLFFFSDFSQCMLELMLLHTEHKQIKHSRKLVFPQFYDPAFVHERDLVLIQVASKSSWSSPKLFSKTFVFFSGFHIFKATGCCRKRCRLVHFPAD